ncbi:solute carrier family 46 member 3-like [Pectinophora gossypiella]|uniref:solute carrier family 46 member 3-like n=1 Tax=Pectinophora gossypiella TaxID=13191 RepID=UPI00214E6650|nr:solute carrier family 46 member 3-like [Pectinophora gossypiella]
MSTDKPTVPEEQPLKQNEEKKETKQENSKFQFEKKSFAEKLLYIKSNITVEPILAGLVIPSMLSRLAIQNLNLEKACRIRLGHDQYTCDALIRKDGNATFNSTSSFTNYEAEVQKVISSIEAWKSVVQTALPTLLVIFMGAWSDRTGNRKFCILLPIIGELLVCISNIISTIFFDEIPVEVTMFFEGFFPAITGGWVLMYLGVFSYISDVTSPEARTFRVGLVNLCMTAGIPIGTALSGILLKLWGYYGIFTISGLIYVLNLIYGLVYLKSRTKKGDKENEKKNALTLKELGSLVKETAAFAFKKREGNMRQKVIITLLIVAIVYGPGHGERIVFYMYLRYKLKWNAVKFSMYSTYSVITHSLGALFSISVFSKRWGFHDSALCLISIISKLVGSIYIVFVTTDFQMFMLPIIEILNATTWTSLRSMASKLVPSEELGKMNSLFSLVETLAALVFDPMYSGIYRLSIDVFSGAVFIFSAGMLLPAITLLLWVFVQHRRETRQRRTKAKEERSEIEKAETEVIMTDVKRCSIDVIQALE